MLLPMVRLDHDWMWFVLLVNEKGHTEFVSAKRYFSLAEANAAFENIILFAKAANDN